MSRLWNGCKLPSWHNENETDFQLTKSSRPKLFMPNKTRIQAM